MISDHIDEDRIRSKTEQYWKLFETYREDPVKRLEYYIENLLPEEIESYEQRYKVEFWYCSPVKYLVLLVGYSFEPLLQSICFHQPEYIIPVISEEYGRNSKGETTTGWMIYDRLSEVVKILHEKMTLCQPLELYPPDEQFEPVPSRPEKVFQYLVKHVIPILDEKHPVVIDITGAKKSMVASAYLFGAYANIPITYVDFEEYDEMYGRPYGYTMEITELKNPYHAFSLHRWKRVQNLYTQHAFKAARVEVEEIISSMENTENSFFNEDQKGAARKLAKLLRLYELWENGDYYSAGMVYEELNDENIYIPSAVAVLREIWPSSKKGDNFLKQVTALESGNEPIFLNKRELLNYIHDELAKIKRLVEVHADYRSAFQRAGGLNDTLFSAKFNILWYKDYLSLTISDKYRRLEFYEKCSDVKPGKRNILGKLYFSTFKIKDLIYKHKGFDVIKRRRDKTYYKYIIEPGPEMPKFRQFFSDDFYTWFRDMRNKAVHFALSPSKDDTIKALNFLHKDIEDFEQNWAGLLSEERVDTSTTPPGLG